MNRAVGRLVLVAVAGLAAAACSDDGDGSDDDASSSASTMSVPEGIERDDGPSTTAPSATVPEPIPPAEVWLAAEGIADLPIGRTPQVDVLSMLAPALGEPEITPAECPGGSDAAARFPGGLTVHFAGGQLSGWIYAASDDTASAPVQTDRDVRPGDTVADLQAAYPDDFQWIEDSTLGTEFFIGTGFPYLGGLASGQAPTDTVEVLWAGDSCAAR